MYVGLFFCFIRLVPCGTHYPSPWKIHALFQAYYVRFLYISVSIQCILSTLNNKRCRMQFIYDTVPNSPLPSKVPLNMLKHCYGYPCAIHLWEHDPTLIVRKVLVRHCASPTTQISYTYGCANPKMIFQ